MGITDVEEIRTEIESGEDWFARQGEDTQRQILGPAKFAAFRDGTLQLSDLVGYKEDAQWGPGRYERSLESALSNVAGRRTDNRDHTEGERLIAFPDWFAAPQSRFTDVASIVRTV